MSDADQIVIGVIEGWGEAKHGAEKQGWQEIESNYQKVRASAKARIWKN